MWNPHAARPWQQSACVLVLVSVLVAACRSDDGPATESVSTSAPAPSSSALNDAKADLEMVLNDQAAAITTGNWRSLFDLYIPEQQVRCPFEDYAARADEYFADFRGDGRSAITAKVTEVSVSGDTAFVEYLLLQDGAVITRAQGDEAAAYRRVNGRWRIAEPLC